MNPQISVRNATAAQKRRLDVALERFREIGMKLPDLEVEFSSDPRACRGHYGLFVSSEDPWRIFICSDLDAVYEHELAHAWAAANLTSEKREDFMDLRGYEVWSDSRVGWNQRGAEGAAFLVQQALSGLPLPPALSAEHNERLAAFELLTGVPDPRLAMWTAAHGDDEQPTATSTRTAPDLASASRETTSVSSHG